MAGKIKAGEGALIGNAGEFYVVAELLKRGVIAALAPRNAPAFDILATRGDNTVKIRVKTKSEEYSDWQWVTKKDGSIFRHLSNKGDFTVLVDLAQETKNMKYYIVPTIIINKWLIRDYEDWVKTPGKNGRPHNPDNKKRQISQKKYEQEYGLFDYLNDWDRLWG